MQIFELETNLEGHHDAFFNFPSMIKITFPRQVTASKLSWQPSFPSIHYDWYVWNKFFFFVGGMLFPDPRLCLYLYWLATLIEIKFRVSPKSAQDNLNASWVTSILCYSNLLADEILVPLPWKGTFSDLHALARKLTSSFGHLSAY